MAQVAQIEDCTYKCRSSRHTGQLIVASSQAVGEAELVAWLARHCHNPGRNRDNQGRSLLHVAASRGLTRLVSWLLTYREAAINSKDQESGYSALHRAVYYGQLRTVILLIKQGANLWLTDNSGLTALDHAVLDRPPHVEYTRQAPLEVYVWGINSNYNLGLGNNTGRNHPDLVEQFRRQNLSICKVAMQKFHSAFLSRSGVVLTCGHGRGGRLGHGSETMQLIPRPVQLARCLDVALGVDHSIFLTEGGGVYTCGENSYHQLGHQPPPPRLLAPAPVGGGRGSVRAVGVAAGRYHSAYWTEGEGLYTWGLNAGQLGHLKGDKTVIVPKLVAAITGKDTKVEKVEVSDGATVVVTGKGEVVALHQYTVKKLGARQHAIQQIQVIGGHLDPAVDPGGLADIDFKLVAGGGTNLRVFLLSKIGKITVWEENRENSFIPCILSLARSPPLITDMALFRDGLVLVSQDGEAWTATWPAATPAPQQAAGRRAVSPLASPKGSGATATASVSLKLKRISHAHRAVAAACDQKGRNFCVLQVSPVEALTEIPEVSPSRVTADMTGLLEAASEYDDLHDTVCRVGGGRRRYALHSFVISAGSETLAKQLQFAEAVHPVVLDIEDIQPVIFEQIVRYLYTRTCDLLVAGPCKVSLEVGSDGVGNDQSNTVSPSNGPVAADDNENFICVEDDPYSVSAFSAYSDRNRKKKNNKRPPGGNAGSGGEITSSSSGRKVSSSSNPLVLLQEAAKSLGIAGLVKIIDCYRYVDGRIEEKSRPPQPRLAFTVGQHGHLADLTIESEEGDEILAHKCILAARSEYFLGMFSSGWAESDQEGRLRLPLKTAHIEAVLEYLYSDQVASLGSSDDAEFVSHVLVVADQFLLTRLKELCENQLSKLITLKNVADFLQFSQLYLANQLEASCLQFVSLNLPAVLESRSLEALDEEMLDRLTDYYQRSNPVFSQRKLRPYSGHPTREEIEAEYAASPLSLEELEAGELEQQASLKTRPRRHSSGDSKKVPPPPPAGGTPAASGAGARRRRRRRTSTDSSGSGSDSDDSSLVQETDRLSILDFDIEEKEEGSGLIQLSPQSPANSSRVNTVPARDKSFFEAILTAEQPALLEISSAMASHSQTLPPSPLTSSPSIMKPESAPKKASTTPEPSMKKFPKLSQKERKKLASAQDTAASPPPAKTAESAPVKRAAWSGWGSATEAGDGGSGGSVTGTEEKSPVVPSLSAIMQGEARRSRSGEEPVRPRRTSEEAVKSATPVAADMPAKKKAAWRQLDLTALDSKPAVNSSSCTSPGQHLPPANPWKQLPPAAQQQQLLPAASRPLAEIMAQEVKEKEVLEKVRSKPLHLTQIEEKAIEELKRFYNVDNVKDEIISVGRVERAAVAATPVWRGRQKPPPSTPL